MAQIALVSADGLRSCAMGVWRAVEIGVSTLVGASMLLLGDVPRGSKFSREGLVPRAVVIVDVTAEVSDEDAAESADLKMPTRLPGVALGADDDERGAEEPTSVGERLAIHARS